MAKLFGRDEHNILHLFHPGTTFQYNGLEYTVSISGKPTCSKGEPKTDIYIQAKSSIRTIKEFKISFKKRNADFIENKITPERAKQLFGPEWEEIISEVILAQKLQFLKKKLIYKESYGKTTAGSITLGWKFELTNKHNGLLSNNMSLSRQQVFDVYSGSNSIGEKRDSTVNGKIIKDSGISNYILFEEEPIHTAQQAIDSLLTIEEYVDKHPDVFFACKALNYRTFQNKYDGNRCLAVCVNWYVENSKLACELNFDSPLIQGGNYSCDNLKGAMRALGVETTDELNARNVLHANIIYP